jgi:FecR protein
MESTKRRRMLRWTSLILLSLLLFAAPQTAWAADDDDPPGRVARLSYAAGAVSFNPAGTDDWTSAVVNRPLTIGDKLWTDNGARAELNLGTAAIRLGDQTGFSFLNLDDRATQIQVTEGTLNVRVRRLDQDEVFEIDTPNLAFSILRPGTYRIKVNESGDATMVAVQTGEGEVTGAGSAYTIRAGESGMFSGVDQLSVDMQGYPAGDEFDRWSSERDRRWDRSSAPRYVSDDVIGSEDLDEYGGWRPVPEYGNVWFPRTTAAGWAPYRNGHWVWISPWGWTWVDDEPWGFAPFHYGRWVVVDGSWGWVPSPPRPAVVRADYVRPVYSPALVAWVGGSRLAVGVGVGSEPTGVAWFPLGPRDVYCPSYHASQRYVERVNVSNTVVVNRTQVTNVYNNVYVNKTENITNVRYQNQAGPNAVTAVSRQAFVAGQPVNRNIVQVDSKEVASAPVAPRTPSVAPQAHSAVGAAAPARVPPAQAMARPVVAKATPPPAPPTFARQQQAIQSNGGRPIARSQERQLEAANQPAARPNVRIAPPARPVTPSNQPANRTSQPNQPAQPGNKSAAPSTQPEQPNGARPTEPNNKPANQPNQPAQPNNRPGQPQPEQPNGARPAEPNNRPPAQPNPPASPRREDRPPSARPASPPAVNPQTEQKRQPQADQMRQQKDQERKRLEEKQQQEQKQMQQQRADQQQRQQQMEQRKQQQQERKPDQPQKPDQRQKPEEKQKPEVQKQQRPEQPPPKENKPPKSDKDKDKPPKPPPQ